MPTYDCKRDGHVFDEDKSPETADNANDIEEKPQAEPRCHWRCRRIDEADIFTAPIGWTLLGVVTRSKSVGKSSEVGTLPPGATFIWLVGSVCRRYADRLRTPVVILQPISA